MTSARRLVVLALALAALLVPTLASADRALARRAMPPALDLAQIRAALGQLEPQVQACARETGWPGARPQLNFYAFPDGQWSIAVGTPRGTPPPGQRGSDPFERCLARAVADAVGGRVATFSGSRPHKISRRYALAAPVVTAAPVTVGDGRAFLTAVVRRMLTRRRAEIQACFPHAPRAPRVEVGVRVEVSTAGALRVTGLRLPPHLDFATVSQCVERAVDGLTGPQLDGVVRGELPFSVQIDPAPAPAAP